MTHTDIKFKKNLIVFKSQWTTLPATYSTFPSFYPTFMCTSCLKGSETVNCQTLKSCSTAIRQPWRLLCSLAQGLREKLWKALPSLSLWEPPQAQGPISASTSKLHSGTSLSATNNGARWTETEGSTSWLHTTRSQQITLLSHSSEEGTGTDPSVLPVLYPARVSQMIPGTRPVLNWTKLQICH